MQKVSKSLDGVNILQKKEKNYVLTILVFTSLLVKTFKQFLPSLLHEGPTLITVLTASYNLNHILFWHNCACIFNTEKNSEFRKSISVISLLFPRHWAQLNIAGTIFSCVLPVNKSQSTNLSFLTKFLPLKHICSVAKEVLDLKHLYKLLSEGIAHECVDQDVRRCIYHLGGNCLCLY